VSVMERHVCTLFCDDVRQEIGNKQSFIGVYSSVLTVPELPFTLQKLHILLSISTLTAEPFEKLIIRLLKNDVVMMESVIPDEALAAQKEHPKGVEINNKSAMTFTAQMVISGFVIEEPFILRVRVETESGELVGTGLKIEEAPSL